MKKIISLKKYFFLIIFMCFFEIFFSQKKIFFANDFQNQSHKNFVTSNKINPLEFFYEQEFVNNDEVDFKKLNKIILKKIPSAKSTTYIVLDWESKTYDQLFISSFSKNSVNQFLSAIKYIKSKRPKVKVGIYALPSREFWGANEEWENKNLSLSDIYKKVDFITPSIYMFYEDSQIKSVLNTNYINKNVTLALKIGTEYKKPVFPMIWHRYHPSNPDFGLMLIPYNFFRNYVKDIVNITYDGKSIDGIFWWQAEDSFRKSNATNKNLRREQTGVKDLKTYDVENFKKYLNIVKEEITNK